jgi:hypothetical protein
MATGTPEATIHLEATVVSLESGVTTLSPSAARGIIERWLTVLADYPDLNDVATALGELRAALLDQPIDGRRVAQVMARLGARTTRAASQSEDDDVAAHLERLGSLLSKAAARLGATAPAEVRGPADAPQQPSTHHGPSPQNTGRKAQVGDVAADGASRTPGTTR